MGWQSLRPYATAPAARTGCSFGLRHRRAGVSSAPSIGINAFVASALGWKAGDRILVELGTGADGGKLRLTRGDAWTGYRLQVRAGGGLTLVVARWEGLPRDRRPREPVSLVVDGGAVVLTLPEWATPATPAARPALRVAS